MKQIILCLHILLPAVAVGVPIGLCTHWLLGLIVGVCVAGFGIDMMFFGVESRMERDQ